MRFWLCCATQYDNDEGDRVLLTTDFDLAGAVIHAKLSRLKVFLFSDLDVFCLLKCCYFGMTHPWMWGSIEQMCKQYTRCSFWFFLFALCTANSASMLSVMPMQLYSFFSITQDQLILTRHWIMFFFFIMVPMPKCYTFNQFFSHNFMPCILMPTWCIWLSWHVTKLQRKITSHSYLGIPGCIAKSLHFRLIDSLDSILII